MLLLLLGRLRQPLQRTAAELHRAPRTSQQCHGHPRLDVATTPHSRSIGLVTGLLVSSDEARQSVTVAGSEGVDLLAAGSLTSASGAGGSASAVAASSTRSGLDTDLNIRRVDTVA